MSKEKMRASRHNGRSGKHGVYDVKHNDRNFDVANSEHIDGRENEAECLLGLLSGLLFER